MKKLEVMYLALRSVEKEHPLHGRLKIRRLLFELGYVEKGIHGICLTRAGRGKLIRLSKIYGKRS